MTEEFAKALGPWPLLQIIFGLIVFSLGVWFIVRGIAGKENKYNADEQRERWEAYNHLENIGRDVNELVKSNQKILDAINSLTSVMWNRRQ